MPSTARDLRECKIGFRVTSVEKFSISDAAMRADLTVTEYLIGCHYDSLRIENRKKLGLDLQKG